MLILEYSFWYYFKIRVSKLYHSRLRCRALATCNTMNILVSSLVQYNTLCIYIYIGLVCFGLIIKLLGDWNPIQHTWNWLCASQVYRYVHTWKHGNAILTNDGTTKWNRRLKIKYTCVENASIENIAHGTSAVKWLPQSIDLITWMPFPRWDMRSKYQ